MPVEMKRILGRAKNYETLSATMVGRQRNFFISNPLERLEKLIIVGGKKFVRVRSQSLQIFKVCRGFKFRFEVLNVFNYKT